jgi:hypothetical protein
VPATDGDLDDAQQLSPLEAGESASSVWERMVERLDRALEDPLAEQGEKGGEPAPQLRATLGELVHLRERTRDRARSRR